MLTAVAAVVALAGATAGIVELTRPAQRRDPLVAQLDRLRGDNGLFFRPDLVSTTAPDLAGSAYGLTLLADAGHPAASPWRSPQAVGAALRAAGQASVWGAWYVSRVERATGSTLPGDWDAGVLASLRPDGFFHDSAQPGTDPAADLATSAAALDVIAAKRLAVPADRVDALDRWLHGAARDANNPYQGCDAASGLNHLGRLDAPTARELATRFLRGTGALPGRLESFENVLDVYGVACLAALLPGTGAEAVAAGPPDGRWIDGAAILRVLRPALTRPVDDTQLLYHVAEAWRLAGGATGALGRLAAAVGGRVDPATGLLRGAVVRDGTLEDSYYVAGLRQARHLPSGDHRLAAAIRSSMVEFGGRFGPNAMLMAAVVLRWSGQPDAGLERRAVDAARAQLSGPVTEADLGSYALAARLLNDLGVTASTGPVPGWPVLTVAARLDAWLALGLSHGRAVPAPFGDVLRDLPTELSAHSGELTVSELRAGVAALIAVGRPDRVPVPALSATLDARRGCPGFPDLYRPTAGAGTGCDLRSSADAVWLRSVLARQKGAR